MRFYQASLFDPTGCQLHGRTHVSNLTRNKKRSKSLTVVSDCPDMLEAGLLNLYANEGICLHMLNMCQLNFQNHLV